MKDHFLDKIILRDLFWFIVLPHRFKQHLAKGGKLELASRPGKKPEARLEAPNDR